MPQRIAISSLLGLSLLLVLSCTDGPAGPELPYADRVSVSPADSAIFGGYPAQFRATVLDQMGEPFSGPDPVLWQVAPSDLGTIDRDGRFRAESRAVGRVTVTARAGELEGSARMWIYPRPIGVRIEGERGLRPDETAQLAAQVIGFDGVDITSHVPVTWSSSDEAVLTVSSAGLVRAVRPGTADVTATSGPAHSVAHLTVAAEPEEPRATRLSVEPGSATLTEGASLKAAATVYDQFGAGMALAVSWATSDDEVARVDENGNVVAVKAGEAAVVASVAGLADTLSLVVEREAPRVKSVVVSPAEVSMVAGDTLRFAAEAFDQYGESMDSDGLTWRSGWDAYATVDAEGLVTALRPGTVSVTATISGVEGRGHITIERAPSVATTVEIRPAEVSLMEGDSAAIRAVVLDQRGDSMQAPTAITWSSGDEAVAAVQGGFVRARSAGSATVSAHMGELAGTASVVVAEGPRPAAVTVSPSSVQLKVGGQATLTAAVVDQFGDPMDVGVAWTSSEPSVATVANGTVAAIGPGTAIVHAAAGGVQGSATVTVQDTPRVATITLEPNPAPLRVGETVELTATVRDQFGAPIAVDLSWVSQDSAVATVDNAVVRGLSAGGTSVVATAGGVSGAAEVVVQDTARATTIQVSPSQAEMSVGSTAQLSATVRDQWGNAMDVPVAWISESPTVASVDGGLVRALAPGATRIQAFAGGLRAYADVAVQDTARASSIDVAPATAQLVTGQTVQLTATVKDQWGNPMQAPVSWASADAPIATVTPNGLVTGRQAGTVAVTARAGDVEATASIEVLPPPALELDASTITLTQIGEVGVITGTIGGQPTSDIALRLLNESRWLGEDAVFSVAGNGLTATGAGTAVFEATSPVAGEPDTLTAHVTLARPYIRSVDAPARIGDGVILTLRGHHMDLLDAAAIQAGTESVTLVARDTAEVRITVPTEAADVCSGAARVTIDLGAVDGTSSFQRIRERNGELQIDVGSVARSVGPCLKLPADGSAEYALVYLDTRRINKARTSWSVYEPDTKFRTTVNDATGVIAGASNFMASVSHTHEPLPSYESDMLVAPAGLAASTAGREFLNQSRPWVVGDQFTYRGVRESWGTMQVVKVYDGYFVFAVPVTEVETVPLERIDTAMVHVLRRAKPTFFDPIYGAQNPTTGSSGQFLFTGRRAPNIGDNDWVGGFAIHNWVEFEWGGSTTETNFTYLLAHEVSHIWDSWYRKDLGTSAAQREKWMIEGAADFVAVEIMRDYYGQSFTGEYGLGGCYSGPYWWCRSGMHSFGATIGMGYMHGAYMMRDFADRLMREAGLDYDTAIRTVARGAAQNWFGCGSYGCTGEGLAEVMARVLGRSWDPVEGVFTYLLSQPADDVVQSDVYRNRTFNRAGDRFSPFATLTVGTGSSVTEFYDVSEGSGGWYRVVDGGFGGSLQVSATASGVAWAIIRLK